MEYRYINQNVKTSLLGFGCMRFPLNSDGSINEKDVFSLIDKAYKSGVNYFDTAYPYHGGRSEEVTGRALSGYPRESYYLATKLPVWEVNSINDVERIFNEQLTRLQKDYVDFYLMHALNMERWEHIEKLNVINYCEKLKREGKIKHIGFSFHDDYPAFEKILTAYNWDFCQIQLNYMDKDTQATLKGVELADALNIPIIVMEPVKGGLLSVLPEDVTGNLKKLCPGASTSSWAMRYVGSMDAVKVILSGMSSMEQLEDNINTFSPFVPLTPEEGKALDNMAAELHSRVKNGCTGCRYCMPCPAGVNIPKCFEIWNRHHVFGNTSNTLRAWHTDISSDAKAINCIKCGKCENVCPQKIHIREDLANLQNELDALN